MNIGEIQTLHVQAVQADHYTLADADGATVPLVRDSTVAALAPGAPVEVFVHTDRLGEPLATTRHPHATLGRCAALRALEQGSGGTWLDWGLDKHLLLPFAEQRRPVEIGRLETIRVYRDKAGRLAATSRLDHHLDETPTGFTAWQPVELLVYQRTDLGFKAVVDDRAVGLLFEDEVFRTLGVGTRTQGFVKRVREDGRLDLALEPPKHRGNDALEERVLAWLATQGGSGELTDASSPEAIRATFQVSKKQFKRALSSLYKARRVRLEPDRTVLIDDSVEVDL